MGGADLKAEFYAAFKFANLRLPIWLSVTSLFFLFFIFKYFTILNL